MEVSPPSVLSATSLPRPAKPTSSSNSAVSVPIYQFAEDAISPAPTPYATTPGPSSRSVNTYSSSSFASIVPGTSEYNYEAERLTILYKSSQESLRLEREMSLQREALWERERVEQEARHRRELDAVRHQYSEGSDKGKRRK